MSDSLHERRVTLDFTKPYCFERPQLLNDTEGARPQFRAPNYQWAWEHYLHACANHWVPSAVSMDSDIATWNSGELTDAQRCLFQRYLGFFGTVSSVLGDNIVLALFEHMRSPEVRQYLLRQAFEEGTRLHAFQHITESLSLEAEDACSSYQELPSAERRNQFLMSLTKELARPDFTSVSTHGRQDLLQALVGFYIIRKGLSYASAFVSLLSFYRLGMLGTAEQFRYILRDNVAHIDFGVDLINGIKVEYPEAWTASLRAKIVQTVEKAIQVEYDFARESVPEGTLGLQHNQLLTYMRYIAKRRLGKIGLQLHYDAENPFPWMDEMPEPGWKRALTELTN